jgi:hypothetical protein
MRLITGSRLASMVTTKDFDRIVRGRFAKQ